jgi:hypothetical protein
MIVYRSEQSRKRGTSLGGPGQTNIGPHPQRLSHQGIPAAALSLKNSLRRTGHLSIDLRLLFSAIGDHETFH